MQTLQFLTNVLVVWFMIEILLSCYVIVHIIVLLQVRTLQTNVETITEVSVKHFLLVNTNFI